jgi:nucleotide-binding universal stress UspA family protein
MAPTDGSDGERSAIDLAVALAKQFDAELRLVRVETPPVVVDPRSGPGVLEQTEQTFADARVAREKKLQALGTELRAAGATRLIASLESGRVEETRKTIVLVRGRCKERLQSGGRPDGWVGAR